MADHKDPLVTIQEVFAESIPPAIQRMYAEQAERIAELEDENLKLRKELSEYEKHHAYCNFSDRDETLNPQETAMDDVKICILCGHIIKPEFCGSAGVGEGPLCHADTHSCYRRWTVHGERTEKVIDPPGFE